MQGAFGIFANAKIQCEESVSSRTPQNRTYQSWENQYQLGRQEIPNDVVQDPTVFVVFYLYGGVNSD